MYMIHAVFLYGLGRISALPDLFSLEINYVKTIIQIYFGITRGRVLNGELLYT